MRDSVGEILRLERQVTRRRRLQSLQDGLVMSVIIGALIAAALVLLMNIRPVGFPRWAVIATVMSLSVGASLSRWLLVGGRQRPSALLIDESFNLDDRVASAISIIERGGARLPLEEALIEDTAARVGTKKAASVAPLALRRWHALSLISLSVLAVTLMIPAPSSPVTEALAAERADIASAGEHLEQTAAEIEQVAPSGTETATLAKEQGEVGRGFRLSPATRAEAFRRLSALEDRIRHRRDDLATTRADEIVSLADRRLGTALPTLSNARKRNDSSENRQAESIEPIAASASKSEADKREEAAAKNSQQPGQPAGTQPDKLERTKSRPPAIPNGKSGKSEAPDNKVDQKPGDQRPGGERVDQKPGDQSSNRRGPGDVKPADAKDDAKGSVDSANKSSAEQSARDREAADQQPSKLPDGSIEALKAVPDSLAAQAAKALPKLSAELIKKAAELRADELTPADIEKLRKAAESLARDLAEIGQSKELQQALKEMAREVRPEQLEQVARELAGQEQLKQELEAVGRLLAENQQAKEIAAGLSGQFARQREERAKRNQGPRGGIQNSDTRNQDFAGMPDKRNRPVDPLKAETDQRLGSRGKQATTLKGKLQQGTAGEYLYLQSKPGVGAARAPYSSAYPQYRREAERAVQRSQVPPNLRTAVRKYFDAINPDAKK